MSLDPKAFALACGILWAAGVVLLAILAGWFGYGVSVVDLIGTVYIGYAPSIRGALIGAVWGFVDGLIGGWLFALLYNKLVG